MDFAVAVEQVAEGTHVVAVAGELDAYTAPDLEQELFSLVAHGESCVIVDLMRTTFIDSVAMAVLVHAHKELQRGGCRLAVATGTEVARFFEIAGLDQYLDLHLTRAEALAALDA